MNAYQIFRSLFPAGRRPDGSVAIYSLWLRGRMRRYCTVNPDAFAFSPPLGITTGRPPALVDHEAFNAWLNQEADSEVHRDS